MPSRPYIALALAVAAAPAVALTRGVVPPSALSAEDPARVVRAALDAMGGDRTAAAGSWYVEGAGRENLTGEFQGLAPFAPTWRPHAECVAVETASGAIAWGRRSARNDQSVRWRRMIHRAEASGFVDWVSGASVMRPTGTTEDRRRALARRIPHLLVREAAAWPLPLVPAPPRRIAGRDHDAVQLPLAQGGPLTLVFSRSPSILHAAEYATHMPARGDVAVRWEWTGWRPHPEFGFAPSGHRIDVDGVPFHEVTYSSNGPDAGRVGDALLTPESGAAHMAHGGGALAAPPFPAEGEVAPGVHVARVEGFTVMFVEFRDFVVALEAPAADFPGLQSIPADRPASQASRAYLALIRKTRPAKPLRYVVVSHHHGDHMGGLRAFAEAGATVIVAAGERRAAEQALSRPHRIVPDGWKDGSAAKVEAVTDRRTITDGDRRLEIVNVGRNPHTDDNLMSWLPAEGILFQGDLFYYSDPADFPPLGRVVMNRFFARWLAKARIAPRAIYGVHNSLVAGPEHLAAAAADTRVPPPAGGLPGCQAK